MVAQCTCAQDTTKTSEFSGKPRWLVISIFLTSLSLVHSQPLNLPAEQFSCGNSNLTCQRWGYTACMNPDGEFYCLPCDHEYLRTLCGTKKETQGCNLYCAQKKVDSEKKKLLSYFSMQREGMKTNCTSTLAEVQSEFFKKLRGQQVKLVTSQKDRDLYKNRMKSLEKELRKETNITTYYKWVLVVFALSYTAAGVFLVIWCRKCRKRDKTSAATENPEEVKLVRKDESVLEWSKESEVKMQCPVTAVHDNATQTENDNVNKDSKGPEGDQKSVEQNDERVSTVCPTKAMFQNVPPTSENGFHKMAIQQQDIDCPHQISN